MLPAELNGPDLKDCVSNHSLSSNASLPSVQSCRRLRERRVASWAVSFERLLQDPLGIRYFSVSRAGSSDPRRGQQGGRVLVLHLPRALEAAGLSEPLSAARSIGASCKSRWLSGVRGSRESSCGAEVVPSLEFEFVFQVHSGSVKGKRKSGEQKQSSGRGRPHSPPGEPVPRAARRLIGGVILRTFCGRSSVKKTSYSGRPANVLIMFPHTTKKRYVSSGWVWAG